MSVKESKNIEEIFSNAFDNFEAPAPEGAWTNIQNQMGQIPTGAESAASGGTATGGGITLGKIALIAVTSSVIGLGGGYMLWEASEEDNKKEVVVQTEEKTPDAVETPTKQKTTTPKEKPTKTVTISVPEEAEETTTPVVEEEKSKERYKITVKEDKRATNSSAVNSWLTRPDRIDWDASSTETANNPATSETTSETTTDDKSTTGATTNTTASDETVVKVEVVQASDAYAEIKASVTGGYAPLVIDFKPEGDVYQTEWDFGDGSAFLIDKKPTYVYSEPGTYTVTLTVINEAGKKDSDQIVIVVEEGSQFHVKTPNIFTPNRDGVNDYFYMTGENINSFELMIFNASNQVVYQSKDINNCHWDGKLPNGLDAPEGVYLYTYLAIGVDGRKYFPNAPKNLTIRR